MTLESATRAGRVAAERNMVDACTVSRVTGTTTDAWGNVTPVLVQVYAGPCKIGGDRPYERTPEVGGASIVVQRYVFHAPYDAGPFRDGHVVVITSSPLQPHLVGQDFRIAGADERSAQTAQRMFVDRIS